MNSRKLEKKTSIATATLLIVLLISLFSAIVEAIDWSPYTQLTTDPGWDIDPSIHQTTDGTIWVVWATDREHVQNDIYYKTSTDNGTSWTNDTRLTFADPAEDVSPSIIQTADGTVWVVWASDRTGNYELFYKTYNGTSWTVYEQLTDNTNLDWLPSIMQHQNGTLWVVWESDREGAVDIYYKTSPHNGQTWSPEKRLTTDPSWDLDPSIIQTCNGTIWLVWTSYRTGNYEIFYKTSADNGASWSPYTQLTTDKGFNEAATITQSRDGSLWIAWQSDRKGKQYDLYYTNSTDHGSTWSPDTQLTTHSADDMSPTIMNSQEGRMWIAWTSARIEDQFDIFYKTSEEVYVKLPGDVDGDGDVDASDLLELSEAYGSVRGDADWNPNCDFNCDGKIDVSDLFDLSKNSGKTT